MSIVEQRFQKLCKLKGDIREHLPTLCEYAKKCETILELGVRGVVSSWAFVHGLNNNKKSQKKLIMNDIVECDIDQLLNACKETNVNIEYFWIDDLKLNLKQNVDMTFIDTLHVYGQLKRELAKFSKITNKYIIMHDTTVDGDFSQIVRQSRLRKLDAKKEANEMAKQTGFSVDELLKGLWPAVEEFLDENKNWKLVKRYTNNNGLTILERI